MWALVALASAAVIGAVSIFDKRLLDRHLPSVTALYLGIAIISWGYIAVVLTFAGMPTGVPSGDLLIALVSGMSFGVGLIFLFVGMKLEEVSRAAAVAQIYPVFVALLAVTFLSESLSWLQWAAIVLVALGAMQISLRSSPTRLLRLGRGTPFLLLASLGEGVSHFAAKYSLEDLPLWDVFLMQQLGVALVLSVFAQPRIWQDLSAALWSRTTIMLFLVGEIILPFVGLILALQATNLGPVSLVAALLATRPLFVFLFSVALSNRRWRVMEESLARGALALKLVSIGMIVVGVSALGLL